MTAIDLLAELESATRAVRQVHLDRLRGLGVSISVIADIGARMAPFGVAQAEPVGAGLYQPGQGEAHIILPVVEDGELVDLVAFRSTHPNDWMLRTGNGWALGLERGVGWHTWHSPADRGSSRHPVGQPPHLSSSPLDWLRCGARGLCIVDWASPEIQSLNVLGRVTVSEPATHELLKRALSRPVRLPEIEMVGVSLVA